MRGKGPSIELKKGVCFWDVGFGCAGESVLANLTEKIPVYDMDRKNILRALNVYKRIVLIEINFPQRLIDSKKIPHRGKTIAPYP